MPACGICSHEQRDELERLGVEALNGDRSWRDAARTGGLTHHAALKNHMENPKHWSPPVPASEQALASLDPLIAQTLEELQVQMRLAPTELKPLYAVAMRNLQGLLDTKPSQQNLIAALKTIHEITGMKLQQHMLLEFAKAAFPTQPQRAEVVEVHSGELVAG